MRLWTHRGHPVGRAIRSGGVHMVLDVKLGDAVAWGFGGWPVVCIVAAIVVAALGFIIAHIVARSITTPVDDSNVER